MNLNKKKKGNCIIGYIINLCFYAVLLFIFILLLQLFCFSSFRIPSNSMAPTLKVGDYILVDKLSKGARIFDVFAALQHKKIKIYRIPGVGKIIHNDILVFNFPYSSRWDSISFDVMKYYVKRCIALPGDTLEIKNGYFKVYGYLGNLGNLKSQKRISQLSERDTFLLKNIMYTFPWDKKRNWTIKNFGPLYIPQKGGNIELNNLTLPLYKTLIEWEQKKKIKKRHDSIFIGKKFVMQYEFHENYYFVAGDKGENSQDSRYWGLLPESYIVGKVLLIWKSIDQYTNKIRWERCLKKVK